MAEFYFEQPNQPPQEEVARSEELNLNSYTFPKSENICDPGNFTEYFNQGSREFQGWIERCASHTRSDDTILQDLEITFPKEENTTPENIPRKSLEGASPTVVEAVELLDGIKDPIKAREAIEELLYRNDRETVNQIDSYDTKGRGLDLVIYDDTGTASDEINRMQHFSIVPQRSDELPHPLLRSNVFQQDNTDPYSQDPLYRIIDKAGYGNKNERGDRLIEKHDIGQLMTNEWYELLTPETQETLMQLMEADWTSKEFEPFMFENAIRYEQLVENREKAPDLLVAKPEFSERAKNMTLHELIDFSNGVDEQRTYGLINRKDIKAFLENGMSIMVSPGLIHYLQEMVDDYNNPKYDHLKNKNNYITRERLNDAFGS